VQLHLVARVPVRSSRESGERPLDAAAALLHQRQLHPQRPCGGRQRHAERCIPARRKSPIERRAQIVDAPTVIVEPFDGRPRFPFDFRPFEQVPIVFCVVMRKPFALAAFLELFARIGARRVEQPVARNSALDLRRDERLRDQAQKPLDYARRGEFRAGGYGGGCLQAERAGEDRETTQHDAFGLGQQLVAPVERRPQRLVPRQGRPPSAGQQSEPIVETGGERLYAEC
jgi:hypothetical protein